MKQEGKTHVEQQMLVAEHHSGPLPTPDVLKGYQAVDPTFPERIMKMAEANNNASIESEKQIISGSFKSEKRGQLLAFVLGILGLIAGLCLAFKGLSAASVAAIITSLAPVLIASINNVISNKNDSTK
jgi:uncharacterized membrane protein